MSDEPPSRELIATRLEQLVAGYNAEDPAAIVALFADDGRFVDIDGTVHHGRDAIHRDHVDRFARSPGSWFEVEHVVIEGAFAVATWRRHRATDGSGTHQSWRGVDMIEFDTDGAIALKSTYAKTSAPTYERVPDR
jgi:uncharacterized protein (TIGR02246 family)